MSSRRKGRKKELNTNSHKRDKAKKKREESQVGHCKEVDLVVNFMCEGLLWEENVTRFLTGGRRQVLRMGLEKRGKFGRTNGPWP